MMKTQDVLLKAMAKKISWLSAAEIIGINGSHDAALAGAAGRARLRRSAGPPAWQAEPEAGAAGGWARRCWNCFQTRYYDFNVKHFHEKLGGEHGIELSYTWVKQALQGAGLVARKKKRTPHRKRRPRKEMPGIMLHIDGSKHAWLQDDRYYDLIVILDDATSEIYYAQLVEEESTATVMAAVRAVIETKGLFCSRCIEAGETGHLVDVLFNVGWLNQEVEGD